MPKSMVIVESPAKARTIGKYLGRDYFVRASAGHIRDLPPRALGVSIREGFRPTYRVIQGKERIVADLKKEAEKVSHIYLAADPDREGEAICFHLSELLNGREDRQIHRVLFNEITKSAILRAFQHPKEIDQHKVEAQQARRILDRLVGYKLSPLLWQKVRKGLSAGRVQTVAVRLIVDREREIKAFVAEEYWEFKARLTGKTEPSFEAKAVKLDGRKFKVSNREEADRLLADLKKSEFTVKAVEKKKRKRHPLPPFITSKLQQDAVRRLGFTVKKTMSVAQRLYEGIELGDDGLTGLITYMRTDSTRISQDALEEARSYIGANYGKSYLPAKAKHYRSKKNAQDAHEAIRPTSAQRDPASVKPFLKRDEYRLYSLIWSRFVASQMNPAQFDQTELVIDAGRAEFKAVGSILRFDGFLKLYEESKGAKKAGSDDDQGRILPDLAVGEVLRVDRLNREQKFTQPPFRYNEASLVKALEEKGIGRPSTYQQILSVIMSRDYVEKEQGRFKSTELGEIVIDLLVGHFEEIFDYDYTAKLERDLDQIEDGTEEWVEALESFYVGFKAKLEAARSEMKNLRREGMPSGEKCPECGSDMVIRFGRYGEFLSCSNYPTCKTTRELHKNGDPQAGAAEPKVVGTCEKCGKPMVVKKGRYGNFIACTGYPACRNTRQIKVGTGVACPKCGGKGEIVAKRSKKGRSFYGCDRYPECDYVIWNKPVAESCPACKASFLLEKTTKKEGAVRFCANKECNYRQSVAQPATQGDSALDPSEAEESMSAAAARG